MNIDQLCNTHRQTGAHFTCDGCGKDYCSDCRGRTVDDQVYCLQCSLHTASQTASKNSLQEKEQHVSKVELAEEKRQQKNSSRRLLALLLLTAIPIAALEIILLQVNKPRPDSAALEAEVESASLYMLANSLEDYREDKGEYPAILELLFPGFLDPAYTRDLDNYSYCRTTTGNYELRVRPEAVSPEVTEMLPVTIHPETDFKTVFVNLE